MTTSYALLAKTRELVAKGDNQASQATTIELVRQPGYGQVVLIGWSGDHILLQINSNLFKRIQVLEL